MARRAFACCLRSSARTFVLAAITATAGVGLMPGTSLGGFEVVADAVKVDALNNQIHFKLLFSEPPDFSSLSPNGNPVHAFQYEIDGDWEWGQTSFGFDRIDSVIRGIEIHKEGNLPIRDTRAAGDEDPSAGGWGRVLDSVPFVIDGSLLSFTVRKDLIDDSNGKFQYRVFAIEDGGMTSMLQRQVVPLPTAVWSGLCLFGGLCAYRTVRNLRQRRAAAQH